MNFKENVFSFLGKCLVMLSMTSMTASYATVYRSCKDIFCNRIINLVTDFATYSHLRSCNHPEHQCHNIFESVCSIMGNSNTVSAAERCDFVGAKLEKVHELFQVCRICRKGVVFYNMAQYGLLHHKSLCN